jgi:hypothetical protein
MGPRVVTPGCCPLPSTFAGPSAPVVLAFAGDAFDYQPGDIVRARDAWALFRAVRPRWTAQARPTLGPWGEICLGVPVAYCPLCGAKLPEIRFREDAPAASIHVPDLSGHYCTTCDRRRRECECLPPESWWEVVPGAETQVEYES